MFLFLMIFAVQDFNSVMRFFLTCEQDFKQQATKELEGLFFNESLDPKQRILIVRKMLSAPESLVPAEKKNFWNLYRVTFFSQERTEKEAEALRNIAIDFFSLQRKEIQGFRRETEMGLDAAFPWTKTWGMIEKAEMFLFLMAADESDKPYILSVILAMQDKGGWNKPWAQFYLDKISTPLNPKCHFYADFARYFLEENPVMDPSKYEQQSPFVKAFLAMKNKGSAACGALIRHCEEMYKRRENMADVWIIQYFQTYVHNNFIKYLADMDLKAGDTLSAIGTLFSSQLGQNLEESNKFILLGIRARALIDLGNKAEALRILDSIKAKKELAEIIRSCACAFISQSDFLNARKLLEGADNPDFLFWLFVCNQIEHLRQVQQEQDDAAGSVVSQGESVDFGDESEQESVDEQPKEAPVSVEWKAQPMVVLSYQEQCAKSAEKKKLKLERLQKLVNCQSQLDLKEIRKINLSPEIFHTAEQFFGVAKEGREELSFEKIREFIIAIGGTFSAESEKIKITFPSFVDKEKFVYLAIDKPHGSRETGVFNPLDTYHHRLIRVLRFNGYYSTCFSLKE